MIRCALAVSVFVVCSTSLLAQTDVTAPGSISGHVYCADTNTPCRFANVTIQTAPPAKKSEDPVPASPVPASHSYSASTDIDGVFQISGVIPGDYYILRRLSGYISTLDLAVSELPKDSPMLAQALDIALTRVTVNSGVVTVSNLTLSRGASFSGTVRYDDGAAAINVTVHLLRKDSTGQLKPFHNGNGSAAEALFAAHTDDLGRFYEPALPPGTYSAEATLPMVLPLPESIIGPPSIQVSLVTGNALDLFYGDKYRLADAATVELHQGEERSGLDINIPTHGLHSVSGFVTAKSDGHAIISGDVHLLDPADKSPLRDTLLREDGSFSFGYLITGTYLLQINARSDHQSGKSAITYDPYSMPIVVDTDIPNLSCALTAAKK